MAQRGSINLNWPEEKQKKKKKRRRLKEPKKQLEKRSEGR